MRTCVTCGIAKPAEGFYPGKRHCKACLLADRKAKYRSDAAMRDRLIARARKVSEAQAGQLLPRECRRCGCAMRRSRDGSPGLCRPCKRLAGYKIEVTRAERLSVYERDGWTCQFCNEPVDPSLRPTDPFAATLDHITPRSAGGSDDLSNLRLLHRWCNSLRRDSPALTLDELVA